MAFCEKSGGGLPHSKKLARKFRRRQSRAFRSGQISHVDYNSEEETSHCNLKGMSFTTEYKRARVWPVCWARTSSPNWKVAAGSS